MTYQSISMTPTVSGILSSLNRSMSSIYSVSVYASTHQQGTPLKGTNDLQNLDHQFPNAHRGITGALPETV